MSFLAVRRHWHLQFCIPFSSRIGSNMQFEHYSLMGHALFPDNLLERNDRMMMAGWIEGRMPFMDTELAALVARFPDEFLIKRHKGGKAVLRAAMNSLPVTSGRSWIPGSIQ